MLLVSPCKARQPHASHWEMNRDCLLLTKTCIAVVMGNKSFLFIFCIHYWRTSWCSPRPGNLCKQCGFTQAQSSWTIGLCILHSGFFQTCSLPLLLEQLIMSTAQVIPDFLCNVTLHRKKKKLKVKMWKRKLLKTWINTCAYYHEMPPQ